MQLAPASFRPSWSRPSRRKGAFARFSCSIICTRVRMTAPSSSSVPAVRTQERKEIALHGALQVLAPGAATDRPDTPDGVVTAVRRIPATSAAYAPFPEGLDERLRAALIARGTTQLYTHQAEAFASVAGGR